LIADQTSARLDCSRARRGRFFCIRRANSDRRHWHAANGAGRRRVRSSSRRRRDGGGWLS
jgi:hypothetical protein